MHFIDSDKLNFYIPGLLEVFFFGHVDRFIRVLSLVSQNHMKNLSWLLSMHILMRDLRYAQLTVCLIARIETREWEWEWEWPTFHVWLPESHFLAQVREWLLILENEKPFYYYTLMKIKKKIPMGNIVTSRIIPFHSYKNYSNQTIPIPFHVQPNMHSHFHFHFHFHQMILATKQDLKNQGILDLIGTNSELYRGRALGISLLLKENKITSILYLEEKWVNRTALLRIHWAFSISW